MTEKEHVTMVQNALSRLSWMPGFPDTPEKFEHFSAAYARFASTEPVSHGKIGNDFIPIDWLVKVIQDSCEWMPVPVVARHLYTRYLPARDGQDTRPYEEIIESSGRRRIGRLIE